MARQPQPEPEPDDEVINTLLDVYEFLAELGRRAFEREAYTTRSDTVKATGKASDSAR